MYTNHMFGNQIFPEKIEKEIKFTKISKVNKEKIFTSIADLENYSKILPNNVIAVKIVNQTNNEIIAEEEIIEAGIRSKILVKHTIIPYENHTMQILNGDAQDTTIFISFFIENSTTIINTEIKMKVKGILLPFGFLPENNLKSAWNSVISEFEEHANKN